MSTEQILESASQGLQSEYGAHTILLYGSMADGSANADIDLDIVGFGAVEQGQGIFAVVSGSTPAQDLSGLSQPRSHGD
jgi:predicted nucleotidyltransferase